MKILKQFITYSQSDQVLSWLFWLSHYCNRRLCGECRYFSRNNPEFPHRLCAVRSVYINISPNPKIPAHWRFPRYERTFNLKEPPSLEFLKHLDWDDEGNPIPLSKRKF